MSATMYHIGGCNSGPQNNRAEYWDTTTSTYTAWDTAGAVTTTRPFTPEEMVSYAPPVVDPTPPAQVDTAGLAVALADAKAAPTLATLQAAIVALGASIAPLT